MQRTGTGEVWISRGGLSCKSRGGSFCSCINEYTPPRFNSLSPCLCPLPVFSWPEYVPHVLLFVLLAHYVLHCITLCIPLSRYREPHAHDRRTLYFSLYFLVFVFLWLLVTNCLLCLTLPPLEKNQCKTFGDVSPQLWARSSLPNRRIHSITPTAVLDVILPLFFSAHAVYSAKVWRPADFFVDVDFLQRNACRKTSIQLCDLHE